MRILILCIFAYFMTACSSNPKSLNDYAQEAKSEKIDALEDTINDVPDWYLSNECEGYAVCGTGTAISQDMQMAIDSAKVQAFASVGESLKAEVSSIRQSFKRSANATGDISGSDKQIIDVFTDQADLTGIETPRIELVQQGAVVRAYVQAKYPLGESNIIRQYRDQISSDQQAFDASDKAVDELMERTGQKKNNI
ncbi:hypothetical protein A3715_19085 [Oleiphilus sp. HI0009]|nr:hypothetical protein A3715_19085 [Oleiphilus sp. HI0009]